MRSSTGPTRGPADFTTTWGILCASHIFYVKLLTLKIPAIWKLQLLDFAQISHGGDRGARTWMGFTEHMSRCNTATWIHLPGTSCGSSTREITFKRKFGLMPS